MFKLSLKQLFALLLIQFVFVATDLLINGFSYLARGDKLALIFVYMIQDICLILSLTLMVFSLYSTYIYQFGLVEIICKHFRSIFLVHFLYLTLSISQHLWIIMFHSNSLHAFQWPTALYILFIIHRLLSPIYYFLFKRTAIQMCDPRIGIRDRDCSNAQLPIE